MKKKMLLLALLPLMLVSCDNRGKSYTFTVDRVEEYQGFSSEEKNEYYTPVERRTIYLAFCESGANETAIEVNKDFDKDKIKLVHTGYLIYYYVVGDTTKSNYGWERK